MTASALVFVAMFFAIGIAWMLVNRWERTRQGQTQRKNGLANQEERED